MKKSPLLEYVLARAEELRTADGRKALNSNYFLAALYEVLAAYADGAFFDEISTPEGSAEISAVFGTLSPYGKAFDDKKDALLAYMREESYSSMTDDLTYGMFSYKAESRRKKEEKELLDTPLYLAVVLAEPTEAIRRLIFKESPDEKKKPTAPTFSFSAKPSEDATPAEETASGGEAVAAPDAGGESKGGKESLADSLTAARSVRDALLSRVYGQDMAVAAFVSGFFQSKLMAHTRTGVRRPSATFLFAGPPGVGKTFLAEVAASALTLPYRRFDMSEYASYDSATVLAGSDKVYKDSKAGTLTDFVAKNPHSILLFDEIEKAHLHVIHLFLQILDAGRLRDAYTDKEVSFSDTVIIFTTNAGRSLYENPSVGNLSSLPKKTVLKALSADKNPNTGAPLFPSAICSRFASGNVVMFNHLSAQNLFTIAKREISENIEGFAASTGISVSVSDAVATATLLAEGGHADARAVKGRANAFFHEELYELFRLIADDEKAKGGKTLKRVDIDIYLDGASPDVSTMFVSENPEEVLVFAEDATASRVCRLLRGVTARAACTVAEAKEILLSHDITLILCDVRAGIRSGDDALNAEDIRSEGRDFLSYALASHTKPTYLLTERADDINTEEFLSFAKLGVRDVMPFGEERFAESISEACRIAYAQENMLRLARENKVLTYKTSQSISEDRSEAKIHLFDFRLSLSRDMTDTGNIIEGAGKPTVRFSDVIGAEGAKDELLYFIEYLKNPAAYLRRGVHAPKGVLLYGPPGTGKTMLARAMAGESDVTFLAAEGNQFLKKYVGEGPEAVHDLFRTARKYAPAILFVDEIDAIGRSRDGSDADYTADILTAFLTEMDGFHNDSTKPVFVLAATNYALDGNAKRRIDPALLRRFDRRIFVDLPNKAERKQFLLKEKEKHARISLSDEEVDNIALRATGMSLADLAQVFDMALRSAIRTDGAVTDEAFEEAFETYLGGDSKKYSPEELTRTARHEAGHALLCWASGETPLYVTVVARGDHGGYMQHANREEKGVYTKEELLSRIRTSLGGRAAELVYYGEDGGLSTGASGDLASATSTAERILCSYGMDADFGPAVVSEEARRVLYLDIRARVNDLLRDALADAKRVIAENRPAIDVMTAALLEKNHLRADEIDAIFTANGKK